MFEFLGGQQFRMSFVDVEALLLTTTSPFLASEAARTFVTVTRGAVTTASTGQPQAVTTAVTTASTGPGPATRITTTASSSAPGSAAQTSSESRPAGGRARGPHSHAAVIK